MNLLESIIDKPRPHFYALRFIDCMTRFTEQLIIHPEIGRQGPKAGLEVVCEIISQRYLPDYLPTEASLDPNSDSRTRCKKPCRTGTQIFRGWMNLLIRHIMILDEYNYGLPCGIAASQNYPIFAPH